MINTIARCFKEGCGISFEKAVSSDRFAEILSQESSLPDQFPATTDEGVALRTNLIKIGVLLNTLSDEQAISEARNLSLNNIPNFHSRAIVRLLGEHIIKAADDCLPDGIGELENKWKSGDAEVQLRVVRSLFNLFVGETQKAPGKEELNWSSANQQIQREIFNNMEHDDHRVLPQTYGKWNGGDAPNCQGKAQMILAFAKRVGARAFCVNTITSTGVVKDIWRDVAAKIIQQDLKDRNIQNIDPTFHESLEAFAFVRSFEQSIPDFFHIGVVLEMCDGRWVLLDPHALTWGILPPTYQMDKIDQLLTKYGRVQPGLSFQAHDHGTAAKLFGKQIKELQRLLQRSRDLEKVLGDASNPVEAFKAFQEIGEVDFIIEQEGLQERMQGDKDLREWFAHTVFFGDMMSILRAMFDPDFLPRRIGSLVTYHHCQAMNLFKDQMTMGGQLVHPECEFSIPEYNIAMSMINSLSITDGTTPATTEFFLNNDFGQITLYNAMAEGIPNLPWHQRERNPELAKAAVQTLSALPFMHSTCRDRINRFFRRYRDEKL
ncbi:MAG: hypothetical protein WC657_01585 [Candidatus Paceibacterota bacterium]|jgi:hypothetical protein